MAMQVLEPGSKWGIIPGSDIGRSPFEQPGYHGVYGVIGPPKPTGSWLSELNDISGYEQGQAANAQQRKQWGQQNDAYDQLMKSIDNQNSNSYYNFKSWGTPIPAPQFASTAGIWSQDQINKQANLQRAQVYAQAQNANMAYANRAAASGFSPMSPLTQFLQNNNMQRAAQSAATNQTNLNWTAAQGNREASQRGESINAGLYGSYTDALARQRQMMLQAQQQAFAQQQAQQQLLAGLIGRI